MSHESFEISRDAEDTAGDIYHMTVGLGAGPVSEYPEEHIEELKKHKLVEDIALSAPAIDNEISYVYMTSEGMDWMDNVVNCQHNRCGGNYEDVYCLNCGADYNNGRLLW